MAKQNEKRQKSSLTHNDICNENIFTTMTRHYALENSADDPFKAETLIYNNWKQEKGMC